MRTFFTLAFIFIAALPASAANFPYIRLNGKTNIISDNGTNLTYNGSGIGGGSGQPASATLTNLSNGIGTGLTNLLGSAVQAAQTNVVTTNFVQKTGDTMTGSLLMTAAVVGDGTQNGIDLGYNHGGLTLGHTAPFQWTGSVPGASPDLILARDAANTLALRNGGTAGSPAPQTLNIYQFWQDAANYCRLQIDWSGGYTQIRPIGAGTGSPSGLVIGTTILPTYVDGSSINVRGGDLLFGTDNAQNIGNASHKVQTVFVGTSILMGTNVLSFNGTNLTWNGTAITVP